MKTKQERLKDKVKREKKEKVKVKVKEEVAKTKPVCKAEKTLATQRRLEERQRQQVILEEMKKPTEDMCLPDHQVLGVMDGPVLRTLVLTEGALSTQMSACL